jgi:hypothetical protein
MIYIYSWMKYALQIYGVFRTFEICLPQILHYLMYHKLDYDVFILSQRSDGYSSANEKRIRDMFGSHLVCWKYIEDYSESIHDKEEQLCQHYQRCVDEARATIQDDIVSNGFVTRLWYRRWLNNQMRRDHERSHHIKYDWVVRTRFDIGYRTILNQKQMSMLLKPPHQKTIYFSPDTLSCGGSEVIDYESDLITKWPYIYLVYKATNKFSQMAPTHNMISKWLFMSEMNLIQYFVESGYNSIQIPHDLKIIRRDMVGKSSTNLGNDHIVKVYCGHDDQWVEITKVFIRYYIEHYNHHDGGATIQGVKLIGFNDVKQVERRVVIMTVENNEYIYQYNQPYLIKYTYFYTLPCRRQDLVEVVYGIGQKTINMTDRFTQSLKDNIIFVSNELAGQDPASGEEKILSIKTKDGAIYEYCEYAIIDTHLSV